MASAVTSALACVALTVLATSQSLLVEAAKARGGGKIPYDTSAAVLLTEALKLGIALCTWLWQRKSLNYTGLESFQLVSWPTAAYAVPATFFIVQNNLVFLALSLLDPPTFQLWACFKIIPVGVLARLMLGQRRSSVQWVSLLLLSLGMGVTTTKQDSGAGTKATTENNPTDSQSGKSNGCLSALSSVLNEWLIKVQDPRAPLMFKNMQIYSWGVLTAAAYSHTLFTAPLGGLVRGLIVLNNAAVGLCVSAVLKYADNLTKGFSTSASVLLASVASSVAFGFVPSRAFLLGAAFAFYLHPAPPF
ncbi:hypothetical protein EMIHUDRAFT_242180 [Emiliania huxleyi CCMP1516]|uniref:Nucleotide-sugar transporter n=2 Tax=Emiliania huxleyi TaxID=2903 RepID=A0A0D3J9W0_EMIH1|nr:hypothetical protein EMIHUDRAFT_242180 [Emiliania huxleyi CCMP1516]EOD20295.1 hypothetical protein EMIHUDRAFT_242180 [Emiliania huxleyi CCMP1516]|eukprot:XP_005772724.1 hypothetical protein EMIHUDRAFT_242180 [Emiliania huxleyi CCMP1516]